MTAYKVSNETRSVVSEDGVSLLDIRSGRFFSLNKAGGVIWMGLSEGLAPEEIEERLATIFCEDRDILRVDVSSFIRFLAELKLISYV